MRNLLLLLSATTMLVTAQAGDYPIPVAPKVAEVQGDTAPVVAAYKVGVDSYLAELVTECPLNLETPIFISCITGPRTFTVVLTGAKIKGETLYADDAKLHKGFSKEEAVNLTNEGTDK